jgi:phosphomannomutase
MPKKIVVNKLIDRAAAAYRQSVARVDTLDGVKFVMSDGSWLLIRPSGTEPVLRIYAEAPTSDTVKALLEAGNEMGQRVIAG